MKHDATRSTKIVQEQQARQAEIDGRVLAWSISQSGAMRRFAREGRGGLELAHRLARDFYPFSFEFPLFLAAAISHVRNERTRILLVDNLHEEHGELDIDRVHPQLFREFMRGVGITPPDLEASLGEGPGADAARRVTEICRRGPAHRPLAALYAIELLFAPICDAISEGLAHLALPEHVTWFFQLHSGADVVHAEQLRAALFAACTTERVWREAVEVAEETARMFFDLFDGIARGPESLLPETVRYRYSGGGAVCVLKSPSGPIFTGAP